MNQFKTYSDERPLGQIRTDAATERQAGLAVIHQLREVRARRLDARLGYRSLHEFCTEELRYSSGSAWRRIKAMEALEDLPELETPVAQVTGLSKRETNRILATIAPMPERPEKLRPIDADQSELRVTLDATTLRELDRVRDLIAHSHPGASNADVIGYLAKLGLKKLDPAVRAKARPANDDRAQRSSNPPPGEIELSDSSATAIPAAIKREVWARDGGKCTYRSDQTGRVCGATAYLQLDHVQPRAMGGGNEASNLRLRCRRHNLLAAVDAFGRARMAAYLK
jgi:hypothetical protein